MKYFYSVYDLIIQSPLLLPSLTVASPIASAQAQVVIEYGVVCDTGLKEPVNQGFTYQANENEFWLNIPAVARFLVSHGHHIMIDPLPSVDEDSIRTFLLSTCMEVLLKQRGLLLMPGYALQIGELGVAFAGIGVGQTMLQGLFYKRGFSFISSNFFVLDNQGHALPGPAQLDLGPQVLTALKMDLDTFTPVRPGIKKYKVPLDTQYVAHPIPLQVIYTLKMHQQSEVLFETMDTITKKNTVQQLAKINQTSLDVWYGSDERLPDITAMQAIDLVSIHLPLTGLKLPDVASLIEQDILTRGLHHA